MSVHTHRTSSFELASMMTESIGYRVTTTHGFVTPRSTGIANLVSQTPFAIGFRAILVGLRVVSVCLMLAASGFWLAEANALRNGTDGSRPWYDGYMAWQLFAVAFTCDFAMNAILWLGSVAAVCLPGADGSSGLNKDMFIKIYAEMGSMADVTRYTIQLVTSLVVFIYSYMALNIHNLNEDCEWYTFDIDATASTSASLATLTDLGVAISSTNPVDVPSNQPTGTGYYFLLQQATVNYFYRQTRLNMPKDGAARVYLSQSQGTTGIDISMPTQAASAHPTTHKCYAHLEQGGTSYGECVFAICVCLVLRWAVTAVVMWLVFSADRPYYILPFSCKGRRAAVRAKLAARKEAEAQFQAGNKPVTEMLQQERVTDRIAVAAKATPPIPVVADEPNEQQNQVLKENQSSLVPDCGTECGGMCDPFFYNILGAFRMHEYVAYLLMTIGFALLAGALQSTPTQATYMPVQVTEPGISNPNPSIFTNEQHTCSFSYGIPATVQGTSFNPDFGSGHVETIYFPSLVWASGLTLSSDHTTSLQTGTGLSVVHASSTTSGAVGASSSSTPSWYTPGQQGCPKTDTTSQAGCCAETLYHASPFNNIFDSGGEQTNPMFAFSIFFLIGSIFYLISTLAYAFAILGLNQSPIPQVTLNAMDSFP